jgi:hypothetical protein
MEALNSDTLGKIGGSFLVLLLCPFMILGDLFFFFELHFSYV